MKVKIGNKIYDPNEEPIMLILTDQDKENIKNMLPNCSKFIIFPDSSIKEDIENWSDEIETKKHPTNTPKRIFLNIGFDKNVLDETQFNFNDLKEVSWSTERISDNDIEYTI